MALRCLDLTNFASFSSSGAMAAATCGFGKRKYLLHCKFGIPVCFHMEVFLFFSFHTGALFFGASGQGLPIHYVNLGNCLECQVRWDIKLSSCPSPSCRLPSWMQQTSGGMKSWLQSSPRVLVAGSQFRATPASRWCAVIILWVYFPSHQYNVYQAYFDPLFLGKAQSNSSSCHLEGKVCIFSKIYQMAPATHS